jgi:hypothetical protein
MNAREFTITALIGKLKLEPAKAKEAVDAVFEALDVFGHGVSERDIEKIASGNYNMCDGYCHYNE